MVTVDGWERSEAIQYRSDRGGGIAPVDEDLEQINAATVGRLTRLARLGTTGGYRLAWRPGGRGLVMAGGIGVHWYASPSLNEERFHPRPADVVAANPVDGILVTSHHDGALR